jgi:hypothetical protein
MATKWISRRHEVLNTCHSFAYRWRDCPTAGFGFECDAQGKIKLEGKCPEALSNLVFCRAEAALPDGKVIEVGLESWTNRYIEPGGLECPQCKRHVTIDCDPTFCECGQPFNLSGQELNPDVRSWGEETGEHYLDIINNTPVEEY